MSDHPKDNPHALSIEDLRGRLDEIDDELMQAFAKRMYVVRAIGQIKSDTNRPVFDREREKVVLDRARTRAEAVGLGGAIGENLYRVLLEASHAVQEALLTRDISETSRHFLIYGGKGEIGCLFERILAERGHQVSTIDVDFDGDEQALLEQADVVLVSVPMHLAVETIERLVPLIRPDQLLCDINSLKADVCAAYEGCKGETLGIHPMFGPTVTSFRRQKFVFCEVNTGPLVRWLLGEFATLGVESIRAEPKRHDEIMAVVQVLVHFRTLVMGEALRNTGVSIEESLLFTSPIYKLELAVVGRLFGQDPALYAEIEMSNPEGDRMRALFAQATERVRRTIESGDREAFEAMFRESSAYFDHFSSEAMALSDMLIDNLVSRA